MVFVLPSLLDFDESKSSSRPGDCVSADLDTTQKARLRALAVYVIHEGRDVWKLAVRR